MKKIVKPTNRDLDRITKRVLNENIFSKIFGNKKDDDEIDKEEIEKELVSMAKFEFNIFKNYGDSERPKYKKMFDDRNDKNTIYVDLDKHFMKGDDFYKFIEPAKKYLKDNDGEVTLSKYNFELDGNEIKITKEDNISEQRLRRTLKRILKENENEKERKEIVKFWYNTWRELRKRSDYKIFSDPDSLEHAQKYEYFSAVNVDFRISKDGESLQLMDLYKNPYDWRNDYQDGVEVIERIQNKIEKGIEDSGLDFIDFRTDSKFNMEIYKKNG